MTNCWSYTMPDGRVVETFPFRHGWRWRIERGEHRREEEK